MTKITCDVCGRSGEVVRLLDGYATQDVREVCEGCMRLIDDRLWKLQKADLSWIENAIQRFITVLKGNQ